MTRTTPMMQQYFRTKEENPDCLLLFRLGDFYEMFGEDAVLGSKLMEITLTSRDRARGERIPMCGVPHHALDSYLPKLLSAGYKVAICDQMEDPRAAKGLVKRAVTRIVTPGTVLEGSMLESSKNNYLASVLEREGQTGLALVDMSSGEFLVTQLTREPDLRTILSELSRRAPSEFVLPEDAKDGELHRSLSGLSAPITFLPPFAFLSERAEGALRRSLKIASIESFGLQDKAVGTAAAAAALSYLERTQKRSLDFLARPRFYSLDDSMVLDASTVRNLELVENIRTRDRKGTLLDVLDQTRTAMGRRLIRRWLLNPLLDVDGIEHRLDAVEELHHGPKLMGIIGELLERVRDIERLVTRVAHGSANARDLLSIASSLDAIPEIKASLEACKVEHLADIRSRLDEFADLKTLIDSAIREDAPAVTNEGGMIRPGFDSELDRLNASIKDSKEWISSLEERERKRLGVKSLKVGYNKVFGYYIEVSKSNLHLVPGEYVRKQTLVGGERFVTPELEEKEQFVLSAEEKIEALELELFESVCSKVSERVDEIRGVAAALAELDVLLSLARTASSNGYARPVVNDGSVIRIIDGRHPVVETTMPGQYIANDAWLDSDERRFVILTGPNMAGKSTYMRQTALIVLMAQMGSFVPAASAEIGIVDRIFTRVGAFDDLIRGQSTFMVEMIEVANILNSATSRSLVLLDEMGRGTSTFDGLSIAWAVVEFLSDPRKAGGKTIFATHYHELTDLAEHLEGVVNQCMVVRELAGEIVFLRKVADGRSDRSYGVHVARLAGLPEEVLRRAEEVLLKIEEENALEVRRRPAKSLQTTLFGGQRDNGLQEELLRMDPSVISPMDAYLKLVELWKRAKGETVGKD